MRIAFFGDIMLSGDQAGKQVRISRKLKNHLSAYDLRVATLETAVGTYNEIDDFKNPKSEVAVWSHAVDMQKLIDLNINVVSLANNHVCDCGVSSMLKLLDSLKALGITPIGAGHNLNEAKKPAVIEKDGKSLAIIGCCEDNPKSLGTLHFATESNSGIYKLDENTIIPQIKELKTQYTYVAVIIHWGIEHKWLPENYDVNIGKKLVDIGADMIIGGHPHHIQPMMIYKGCPIYYSLGNLYFPDFCLDRISNTYYPNELELKNLPVFSWMAPDKRNFAMLYFWKYYGRLGMVASISLNKECVKSTKCFVIYNKGYISYSSIGLWQSIKLNLFSHFVGKDISVRINHLITRTRFIIENKVLAKFIKKYNFNDYVKKQNSMFTNDIN